MGSQKAWFNTYFYPQSGGSYYQQSGYIYTSFLKTGKLWWADGGSLSPQGVIYSTIDGQGGGVPIAAVDNASRVIKYVVTLGQRYQSYSLVDMRVHDVNVVANLSRHDPSNPNPTEPVEQDGTPTGLKPSVAATSFTQTLLDMSAESTISWWTGWWPVLHVRTSGVLESGATYSYQVAVDILGITAFEGMNIETPADDGLSDAQVEAMAQGGIVDFLMKGLVPEQVLAFAATCVMFAIDVLMSKWTALPTPAQLAVLALLVISYTSMMLLALSALWDGMLTHRLQTYDVFWTLAFLAGTLMMEGYWNWGKMSAIWAKWWLGRSPLMSPRNVAFCLLSFFILAIKALFIGVILAMMLRCWELWCRGW